MVVVQFLIPILVLVCLFSFFMRQSGDGSSGIGTFSAFRGKGRRKKKGKSAPITFDSVAGAGKVIAELREIRDFLEDPSNTWSWVPQPKGVLLVGPPGTARRLLSRATAGEADAASGAEFAESLVGVGAARIWTSPASGDRSTHSSGFRPPS